MRINPVDAAPRRGSAFTTDQRAIFRYGHGLDLRGDPIAIDRRHDAAMATRNPTAIASWLRNPDPNLHLLAFRRLAAAAHEALGTVPLEDGGAFALSADEALAVIGRFFAFRGRVTEEYREEAEMVAVYGPAFGGAPGYRQRCGLWWNRRRVQSIAAVAAFRGATAARGGPLHETMADAMASCAEEAAEIAHQYESDRQMAAARDQHRQHSGT